MLDDDIDISTLVWNGWGSDNERPKRDLMSFTEIGHRLGISPLDAQKACNRALNKIRREVYKKKISRSEF